MSEKIVQIPLDATTRLELASMVYARWAKAYDAHKLAKAQVWETQKHVCPKADWPLFYEKSVEHAEKELKLATKLKQDICEHLQDVFASWQ